MDNANEAERKRQARADLWEALLDGDETRAIEAIDRGAAVLLDWPETDDLAANRSRARRLRRASESSKADLISPQGDRSAISAAAALRMPKAVERMLARTEEIEPDDEPTLEACEEIKRFALIAALATPLPVEGAAAAASRQKQVLETLFASFALPPWDDAQSQMTPLNEWVSRTVSAMRQSGASTAAWAWMAQKGALDGLDDAHRRGLTLDLIGLDAAATLAALIERDSAFSLELDMEVERRERRARREEEKDADFLGWKGQTLSDQATSLADRVARAVAQQPSERETWHGMRAWELDCAKSLARGRAERAIAAAKRRRWLSDAKTMATAEARGAGTLSGELALALEHVWDLGFDWATGEALDAAGREQAAKRLCALIAEPGAGGSGWLASEDGEKEQGQARRRARGSFWSAWISREGERDAEREAMGRAGVAAIESGLWSEESFWAGVARTGARLGEASVRNAMGGRPQEFRDKEAAAIEHDKAALRRCVKGMEAVIRAAAARAGADPHNAFASPLRQLARGGVWMAAEAAIESGAATPKEFRLDELALLAVESGSPFAAERFLERAAGQFGENEAWRLPGAIERGKIALEKRVGPLRDPKKRTTSLPQRRVEVEAWERAMGIAAQIEERAQLREEAQSAKRAAAGGSARGGELPIAEESSKGASKRL
jgi:hypothetical protein